MFLPSLGKDGVLLDVFKRFPASSKPLIEYHEALLRGPSAFTVAQRELMAAYVSGLNECHYCHGVHAATAERFGIAPGLLAELIDDPNRAAVEERMKPVLVFARKLTLTPSRMTQEDADRVFAAGWDEQALHDAVSVCALFNMMNRLVDGLGIEGNPGYFSLSSERLFSRGYAGLLNLLLGSTRSC